METKKPKATPNPNMFEIYGWVREITFQVTSFCDFQSQPIEKITSHSLSNIPKNQIPKNAYAHPKSLSLKIFYDITLGFMEDVLRMHILYFPDDLLLHILL